VKGPFKVSGYVSTPHIVKLRSARFDESFLSHMELYLICELDTQSIVIVNSMSSIVLFKRPLSRLISLVIDSYSFELVHPIENNDTSRWFPDPVRDLYRYMVVDVLEWVYAARIYAEISLCVSDRSSEGDRFRLIYCGSILRSEEDRSLEE